jgi:hypothetical protein
VTSRARLRAAAAPPPCTAVPRPGLEVWTCAQCASASHAPPGAASAGEPARHATCARSPRRRRSARRARTPRPSYSCIEVLGRLSLEVRCLCASAIKGCPLHLPHVSTPSRNCRHRRELAPPQAPAAGQGFLALSWIPLELPPPRIHIPRVEPRRKPSRNGHAVARRSHLRPSHHHQSTRGESNRTPASFVVRSGRRSLPASPPPLPRARL